MTSRNLLKNIGVGSILFIGIGAALVFLSCTPMFRPLELPGLSTAQCTVICYRSLASRLLIGAIACGCVGGTIRTIRLRRFDKRNAPKLS